MTRVVGWAMGCMLAATMAAGLSGCDDSSWFGDTPAPPLPGKRIAVLVEDQSIKPDIVGKPHIVLPPPESNSDWPDAGGYTNHAMQHMVLGDKIKEVWSTNVGEGSGKRVKLLAQPIVAGGRVFTLDAANQVSAVDATSGALMWSKDITPEDVEGGSGGGIAYEDGRLFVSTGFAQMVAMDAKSGDILWRATLSGPMRGAPTARGGRVLAITVDNQTHCLDEKTGQVLWSHQGISEQAALLGGNSPAIDGDVAVVPYSSGELFALRLENGAELWQDSLAGISRTQGIATLTAISGRPIINRGSVFAIGHADLMVAIDVRSGRRLWERPIGGIQSPWIAGDYLFLVDNDNRAMALSAKTGQVEWVTQLQTLSDPTDKSSDPVVWSGPVLASDRLIFAGSNGQLISLSPYTGEIMGKLETDDDVGVNISPVVANGTLYIFTDDANVVAYRQ